MTSLPHSLSKVSVRLSGAEGLSLTLLLPAQGPAHTSSTIFCTTGQIAKSKHSWKIPSRP